VLNKITGIDGNKEFLSVSEFAKIVNLDSRTIRKSIKDGRISALKFGGDLRCHYRIPKSELERLAKCNMRDILKKINKEILDD